MKAAAFTYHAPSSIAEAVALIATHGEEAKVLAGGQSLVPMLALRLARFDHLVDLNRIDELNTIEVIGDALVIGAMTRQSQVERSDLVATSVPLLAQAVQKIGHFQIRNRGTIGGSIAHADPASELPAVALCLNATMELAGPQGSREVPAGDFFVSVWQTAAATDEILTRVRFPLAPPRSGAAIEEFALRTGDFAIAGAVASIALTTDGLIADAAIAFMGMGATPLRASSAERALVGATPDEVDLTAIAKIAVDDTEPSEDIHASADYRRKIATGLVERTLVQALKEASHG